MGTVISTWFVGDDRGEATYSPQLSMMTHGAEAQNVYWRCVGTFFASSVLLNKGRRHLFFTNSKLPIVDGVSFEELFKRLNVEVVDLEIKHRLPAGSVGSWGNQFYILDIIDYISREMDDDRYLIFDSDCIWIKSASILEENIDRYGAITYDVYKDARNFDRKINGVTERELGQFLRNVGDWSGDPVIYCGGEQFSCTRQVAKEIADGVPSLWAQVLAGGQGAPREEAHFLSLIYAQKGYGIGTADSFIRRIWTTLRVNNAGPDDFGLTVWHVPAEKVSGLRRLFRGLRSWQGEVGDLPSRGFRLEYYSKILGIPRRDLKKVMLDVLSSARRAFKKAVAK